MSQTAKLRIGVLSQAHGHAHSYAHALSVHPAVDFVGIWDEDSKAGGALADACETIFFADINELLNKKLDGVIVTSENVFHRRLTEAAAESGVKAILCEKPIATSIDDARAMIDVCDKRGVKLATAFPCRFAPAFSRLNDEVHSGKLGRVVAIRATNHGMCPFGWFIDKDKSGGAAIIDHTVHAADLHRLLLGAEAVEVYAERGNNMYHQAWEDCGFLTISYDNGVFATLDSSWSRPSKSFPTWGDVTLELLGTAGTASLNLFGQAATYHGEADGKTKYLTWCSNMDAGMVADFLKLAAGQTPDMLASGVDGLKALEVALAAYESVRTGKPVKL